MLLKLFTANWVPVGCAITWLPLGAVETFPLPVPHKPQVPFPSRQVPDDAIPDPNSLGGTNPETKFAFVASPVSTYPLVAACKAEIGLVGSVIGPVIVPPAVGRNAP